MEATGARGKLRGFTIGAAARHSQPARVHTCSVRTFFFLSQIAPTRLFRLLIFLFLVIYLFSKNFPKSPTTSVFVTSQISPTHLFRLHVVGDFGKIWGES